MAVMMCDALSKIAGCHLLSTAPRLTMDTLISELGIPRDILDCELSEHNVSEEAMNRGCYRIIYAYSTAKKNIEALQDDSVHIHEIVAAFKDGSKRLELALYINETKKEPALSDLTIIAKTFQVSLQEALKIYIEKAKDRYRAGMHTARKEDRRPPKEKAVVVQMEGNELQNQGEELKANLEEDVKVDSPRKKKQGRKKQQKKKTRVSDSNTDTGLEFTVNQTASEPNVCDELPPTSGEQKEPPVGLEHPIEKSEFCIKTKELMYLPPTSSEQKEPPVGFDHPVEKSEFCIKTKELMYLPPTKNCTSANNMLLLLQRDVLDSKGVDEESSEDCGEDEAADTDHDDPPDDLCCPISFKLLLDPVVTSTGCCYDRKTIQEYVDKTEKAKGPLLCPMTKLPMCRDPYECLYVRNQARNWLEAHPNYKQ